MGRRGHSTTIGKFAKRHRDHRMSEIRVFGELLRGEPAVDVLAWQAEAEIADSVLQGPEVAV